MEKEVKESTKIETISELIEYAKSIFDAQNNDKDDINNYLIVLGNQITLQFLKIQMIKQELHTKMPQYLQLIEANYLENGEITVLTDENTKRQWLFNKKLIKIPIKTETIKFDSIYSTYKPIYTYNYGTSSSSTNLSTSWYTIRYI